MEAGSSIITKRQCWYGIDLFKILASILIVFMHTYNYDMGAYGSWIKYVLSTACVPFFFIVSGFLLRNGLDKSMSDGGVDCEKKWFKRYEFRIVKMYLVWSIITFPVALLVVNRGHPEYRLGMKVLYHLRLFFLTGSIGVYWYLLALMICAPIIRWCHRKRLSYILLVISVILYIWGCVFNSPANNHKPLFEIIHVVFGSERNFLNEGFFYLLLGFLIPAHKIENKIIWKSLSVFFILGSIALRTMEYQFIGSNFLEALVAVSMFIVALAFGYHLISGISLEFRKTSVGIYLLHFPFILLFDFYLTKGTVFDFSITLAFSVLVYYIVSVMFPGLSKLLFGYSRS